MWIGSTIADSTYARVHNVSEWVEGHSNWSVNDTNKGPMLWQANKTQLGVWLRERSCQLSICQHQLPLGRIRPSECPSHFQTKLCMDHHGFERLMRACPAFSALRPRLSVCVSESRAVVSYLNCGNKSESLRTRVYLVHSGKCKVNKP